MKRQSRLAAAIVVSLPLAAGQEGKMTMNLFYHPAAIVEQFCSNCGRMVGNDNKEGRTIGFSPAVGNGVTADIPGLRVAGGDGYHFVLVGVQKKQREKITRWSASSSH
jgi:hypothetical protein